MNLVDLVVLALAVVAALRGWRLGLLGQVFELGGGFGGLMLGVALGPQVADMVTEGNNVQGAVVSLVTVFVCVSVGQTVGYLLGHRFGSLAQRVRLGAVNSGLGSALGVGVVLLSFWLVGSLIANVSPSRDVSRAFVRSRVLASLNDALPQPPDVLGELRQYLDTSGFPQVFVGLPRSVSPPVDLPSNAAARRAVDAARTSTVRILVPACGGTQLGSGWVAGEDTVVTNAHVVAGGEEVTVQQTNGVEVSGSVVLFDPRTDIAIVHVDGALSGPVLRLDTDALGRGTPGATLGFPGAGGGRQVWHRAAIAASYRARGKDIYGRAEVTRAIYELRSPVRQGDSGGPFVTTEGDVAGVVFAAATTDGRTGYALTGFEVQDEVRAGIGRATPVATGRCAR
ncbi:MAG: MarP family serine protease [Actinomycetota bacterium]